MIGLRPPVADEKFLAWAIALAVFARVLQRQLPGAGGSSSIGGRLQGLLDAIDVADVDHEAGERDHYQHENRDQRQHLATLA